MMIWRPLGGQIAGRLVHRFPIAHAPAKHIEIDNCRIVITIPNCNFIDSNNNKERELASTIRLIR